MSERFPSVPWYRSLRFKLVAAAIAVELVMLTALLVNSFRLLDEAVVSQTQARLEALSPLLDTSLAGRVFQRDHAEVQSILDRLTTAPLTEICHISVLDPAGNLIATAGKHSPATLPAVDRSVAEALSDLTYDARLPLTIAGTEVGSVHFGLSLASMVATQKQLVREGVIIAAVEILLSLLLLISGGYLITRRLGLLTAGARRLAEGDYDARIAIQGRDEIGMLARDFNAMAAAIATHVENLRTSEMRAQAIFNSVGEAIFIHDAESGRILDVNRAMCAMFTCSREEAIGNDMAAFSAGVPPHDLAGALARIRAAAAGAPQGFDWLAKTLSGRLFWIEVSLRLATIGAEERVLAVVRDISERKKNEEHITRLAAAIEQAAEDIIITDARGLIEYVNPAQKTTSGYAEDELLGRDFSIFAAEGQGDEGDQALREAIREGRKWEGRLRTHARDGAILLQETSLAPITDPEGKVAGFVVTRRDVTKQVETELRLAQSQKMEAIGTLAGGIAHDFNNILSAILGYTELALLDATDDRLTSHLGHIQQASLRARDLVQQILAFSRKAAQRMVPLRVSALLKEDLKLLRATIPTTVEIRQEIDSEATVLADPTQLHQVFMNLCTNAYHAMQEQGGVLTIALREVRQAPEPGGQRPRKEVLPPGNYLAIEVSDNGSGMDRETIKKIFDPYFTTKELGRGTGLGLAVAHGIVKSHGGRISVSSEPGKGSTFRVYLPTVVGGQAPQPEPVAAPTTESGRNERIIFVDDEEGIRQMAGEYLTGSGYRVELFANGAEALVRLRRDPHTCDLLITDMAMPDLDGRTLAQEALALRPGLPIILCTGYSPLINAESARKLGIREYVQKPVIMSELLARIRKALS